MRLNLRITCSNSSSSIETPSFLLTNIYLNCINPIQQYYYKGQKKSIKRLYTGEGLDVGAEVSEAGGEVLVAAVDGVNIA